PTRGRWPPDLRGLSYVGMCFVSWLYPLGCFDSVLHTAAIMVCMICHARMSLRSQFKFFEQITVVPHFVLDFAGRSLRHFLFSPAHGIVA
ncbi:MAG: hypothetical protein ACLQM8_17570, partial [Limisphaerales bacterium]